MKCRSRFRLFCLLFKATRAVRRACIRGRSVYYEPMEYGGKCPQCGFRFYGESVLMEDIECIRCAFRGGIRILDDVGIVKLVRLRGKWIADVVRMEVRRNG